MNVFEAIILGLIQGITEFLPISSTGHLTLAGRYLHLIDKKNPEEWTAIIAIIQLGTLISILIYFWKDIIKIIQSFFTDNLIRRKKFNEQSIDSRIGWYVIIGSIPVVIVGLLFKDIIEGTFTKDLRVIAFSLIILAVILAIAEKTAQHKRGIEEVKLKDALFIGIAQCFALIPGASRSGTTITGGLFAGLNRETAARFSFLLSMPAIAGSGLLQMYEAVEFIDDSMLFSLIIAIIVAGISGYLAIDFLLKFLKNNTTFIFIYYRIILGILILIMLFNNYIKP
ncbi:MAG TPA: undecaprenyl-diphosphatase UppP [Ignavibacteriaceae bacterium]|nr:undecaprenyl-diphosphatase UppP [Ignavibacteriaceae bacterium]